MADDFYAVWNGTRSLLTQYIAQEAPYLSGVVFYSQWRTNNTLPYAICYIVSDSPEVRQFKDGLYMTNATWRVVFRQARTSDPDADVSTMMSGLGAICNAVSDNPVSANWDRMVITNVDFQYMSPEIDVGSISEGAVDISVGKGAEG